MISVRTLSKRHGDARGAARRLGGRRTRARRSRSSGRRGGGKSTLLRCLNYLEAFDARRGRDRGRHAAARHGRRDARRCAGCARKVGMVFQQFNLFPHLTALDNITLAPRDRAQRRRAAPPSSAARELLARVGLGDRARRVSARALGRPAAARRDRARARAGSRGAAVRRADQRARSGDARRGDGGDQGPRGAAA